MNVEIEVETGDTHERYSLIQHKVQEYRIRSVWREFAEADFKPILIKGWAAGLLYPEAWQRHYSDLDLVFAPAEFLRAQDFVKEKSFQIPVDLHKVARHLDSLPFEELWENSILKSCGDVELRIPSEEDHLRILAVHWLNDGGAYRERLWDIFHAVGNRSPNFDWDKCLGVVSAKRRYWIVCAIGLAHRYLNLEIGNTPFESEAKDLPRWLIRSVEKEWAEEVRLQPLQQFFHDKKGLWKQVRKRIPPNAIQATIELDGYFDKRPRFIYQFANIFTRLYPSLKRISQTKLARWKNG